jgi:hypothetical protein
MSVEKIAVSFDRLVESIRQAHDELAARHRGRSTRA